VYHFFDFSKAPIILKSLDKKAILGQSSRLSSNLNSGENGRDLLSKILPVQLRLDGRGAGHFDIKHLLC